MKDAEYELALRLHLLAGSLFAYILVDLGCSLPDGWCEQFDEAEAELENIYEISKAELRAGSSRGLIEMLDWGIGDG